MHEFCTTGNDPFKKKGVTMRFILYSIIVFVLLASQSYAEEIKIGLIPEQNVFKQMKRYKPIGHYIEKKTGIKIKFTILSRYGNIIDNFQRLGLDGAFWGSFTGALAIEKLGVEHIARPVNLDGTSSYRGYIFVHKNSIIDSVERMRHMVIAFVDKATTAGYIFPVAYLKHHGVRNINTYFKEYFFTGSHDAAIYAVLNKEADIGCAKNTIFDALAKNDPRVKNDLVILATSPDVPSNGLGLKNGINPDVRDKLKTALLGMDKDPEGKKVLDSFGVLKFIETTEADYKPVFDAADKAGINLKTYQYINK
jgi:phosphonate transport system substrate-binding protein